MNMYRILHKAPLSLALTAACLTSLALAQPPGQTAPEQQQEQQQPQQQQQQPAADTTSATPAANQPPAPADTHNRPAVLLIVGAPGTPEYGASFQTWGERWQTAATTAHADFEWIGPGRPMTPAPATTTATAPDNPPTPTPAPAPTDLELIRSTLRKACSQPSSQPLWLIYIGHGTFDQQTAALNLRGPDLTATELAELLKPASRPVVAAICASCSAPFINALSAPGRIVISATKDGNQIQYSRFGDAFSQAIGTLDADADRDGQTSLLEAWLFASRRTADFYKTAGRLATEHSLLEDNADSRGVRAELFDGVRPGKNVQSDQPIDGTLAAKTWLVLSPAEQQLTPDQQLTRSALEARLEALKLRRSEFDEADYLQQLEDILRPLAQLYQTAAQQAAPIPPAP